MTDEIPILTLDGPSGSGKGTIARAVAARLGWHLLDSGAIYRLLALASEREAVPADDEQALVATAARMHLDFAPETGVDTRALLDGEDVTELIRTEACGDRASQVAAIPGVREALLQRQRDFRQLPGLVADGRDMGTIVFPQAPIKVFLTASVQERARRRHKQLKDQGVSVNLHDLSEEIAARDERDANRSVAPLVPAADAVVVDTTDLDIGAAVEAVLGEVRRRQALADPN